MKMFNGLWWHNFVTGENELFEGIPTTDEKAIQYIPPTDEARKVYFAARLVGNNIVQAMTIALGTFIEGDLG